MAGIYCIHILDPDDKTAIIPSIDRIYAKSANEAEEEFKRSFPWVSNWLVKAKPTWTEKYDNATKNQKASKKAHN